MSALDEIGKWAEAAMLKASTNTNMIVKDLFDQTVLGSPSPSNPGNFAKGLLVNQYYPQVGGDYDATVTSSTDDFGAESYTRIEAALEDQPFFGKDNVITLSNNTEEAIYAEKIGWPKGGGANGFKWSGNTGPYAMRENAINYIVSKYTT